MAGASVAILDYAVIRVGPGRGQRGWSDGGVGSERLPIEVMLIQHFGGPE